MYNKTYQLFGDLMKKIFLVILLCFIITLSFCNNAYSDETSKTSGERTDDRLNNNFPDKLHEQLRESVQPTEPLLINYDHFPTDEDANVLKSMGVEIVYKCKYIPVIQTGEVPKQMLNEIMEIPCITFIDPVPVIKPFLDISAPAVKARESEEYSPYTAWELGFTGQGVTIAVLDTGVDDGHPSLTDKFIAGADFVGATGRVTTKDGTYNPDDDTGHGTAIAGIAMGTGGNDEIYKGIAPEARLIDVRVSLGRGGNLLSAFEWCIDNRDTDWNNNGEDDYDGIDIVSISLGGDESSDGTEPVCQLLNQMVDMGIVVVAAAGNNGPNNDGLGEIAATDNVITVGNLDIRDTINRDDDEIHITSSHGPRTDDGDEDPYDELKPDIVAPGTNIMAPDFSLIGQNSDGYTEYDGSSIACPHVSGICALMLDANPKLRPMEIKKILHETAEAKGEPDVPELSDKYNYAYGFGSVDAYEAVKMAKTYQIVNHPPVIESVTATPQFVRPTEEATITTTATDLDNDPLIYEYTVPAGEIIGTGPEVTWVAPEETGDYEITVTVDDGLEISQPGSVIVTVDENPPNHPPVIERVDVAPTEVDPGGSSNITVIASDPDNDEIFYEYTPTGGQIIGTGPSVVWVAPNSAGEYQITISVNDGELSDETKIKITVVVGPDNKPPDIESFTSDKNRVETGDTALLQVRATDPEKGELQYSYFTSAGEITGSGPTVYWKAPINPGNYLIEVTVTDNGGLTDVESMLLEVYQPNLPPQILEKRAYPQKVENDGTVEVLFTLKVADGNGIDDISTVTIDLSPIFGPDKQKMYDNGKFGDQTKYDGVYSVSYLVPRGVDDGRKTLPVSVQDFTGEAVSDNIAINITAVADDEGDKNILTEYLPIPGFEGAIMGLAVILLVLIQSRRKTKLRNN